MPEPGAFLQRASASSRQWFPALRRTPETEAARLELRRELPTLASVSRLAMMVMLDPAKQGQRLIRSRRGWAWTCRICHREADGEPEARPVACRHCRASGRYLEGHDTLVYYLADQHGSGGCGYDGGIGRVDLLLSVGWWLKSVAGHRVYTAVDGWVLGLPTREVARECGRSDRWVRAAVATVRDEWEREEGQE